MSALRLGSPRCAAEVTVATRSLVRRATRRETVRCERPVGHADGPRGTSHLGVATSLRARFVTVTWHDRRGRAVLLSPDNLVEVPR